MDRISEASESLSEKSGASGKKSRIPVGSRRSNDVTSDKSDLSSSVAEEVMEEVSQSEKTSSGGLKIQTGMPARGDVSKGD